jgi:hypothetical protein
MYGLGNVDHHYDNHEDNIETQPPEEYFQAGAKFALAQVLQPLLSLFMLLQDVFNQVRSEPQLREACLVILGWL